MGAGNELEDRIRDFTYTDAAASWWRRTWSRLVERLTGQPYFAEMYLAWHAAPPPGESFFAGALRLLGVELAFDAQRLAAWPATGPLVVVCNHPFGVVDGIAACHLATRRRGDVLIIVNDVLDCIAEMTPYTLPIDFTETAKAMQTNLRSRQRALEHIRAGGCLIVFPAGGISTTPRLLARKAVDAPWKTFVSRLVREGGAAVAPVFFPGQNSLAFQLASHLSMDLRLALMFHETRRLIGKRIEARLGEVMPFEALRALDRAALTRHLRDAVHALTRS